MRRVPFLLVLVLLLLPETVKATPDAVEEAFQAYKQALLTSNGEKAAEVVTQSSHDLYRDYAEQALSLDRAAIGRLHIADRITVLLLRHDLAPERLAEMTGGEVITHAVRKGWISKEGTSKLLLGNFEVDRDFATGTVLHNDGSESSFKLEFVKEDGQWRLDLVRMLELARIGIQHAVEQTGMNEDEFVLFLLEFSTGRKADASIWDAPS